LRFVENFIPFPATTNRSLLANRLRCDEVRANYEVESFFALPRRSPESNKITLLKPRFDS